MIKIEFTEEAIQILNYERYNHLHPRVQRKMEALWLKSQELPHKKIAQLTDVSVDTLTDYLRDYKEGGLEKLKEIKFYRPVSKLVEHSPTLENYFRQHPPSSIKEAMSKIEEITGLKRSEPQVHKFLKSIGIKRRKVGMVPAKADIEKQEAFKKKSWSLDLTKPTQEKGQSFL